MTRREHGQRSRPNRSGTEPHRRRWDSLTGLFLAVGLTAAVILLLGTWRRPASGLKDTGEVTSAGQTNPARGSAVEASADPVRKLAGRWERPDGGYVLEVSGVGSDGTLRAAYYNPNPIYVSRVETGKDTDNRAKLFVELQDTGYPGCNYTLTYDPTNDVLAGVYYQAALQESYDVVFTRLK